MYTHQYIITTYSLALYYPSLSPPPPPANLTLSLTLLSHFFNTYLDKLLALYDPGLAFEEPSSGNDCEDDKVDLLADLPQFSVAMLLQSSLQVLSIKHLQI